MIKLKNILWENILLELSEKNTLYHRSLKKMKVGEIIKPYSDKSGTHWLANKAFEAILEEYRKESYPEKPSRLNCIYSSLIPRSRFIDKGYLYVIKPIGKMFMTNSMLIDKMDSKFSRETMDFYERGIKNDDMVKDPQKYVYYLDLYLANKYWNGEIDGIRNELDKIEILSESAKIIEVVDEDKLNIGDDIKITKSNKVYADITLYFDENDIDKYTSKNDEVFNKFINDCKELFSSLTKDKLRQYEWNKVKDGNLQLFGKLKKGVKLKILWIESTLARPDEYGYDDDENDRRKEGKYKQMKFQFYLNNKLYDDRDNKKNNGLPNYSMRYFNVWEQNSKNIIFDISKYMKKV